MRRFLRAHRGRLRLGAAAFVATHWLGGGNALAYCRTTTCGSEKSADCAEPSRCPSGGIAIFWPDAEVSIGVENGSGLRGISAETARVVLTNSMNAWTSVDCGGRPPSIAVAPIQFISGGPVTSANDRDATSDSVNAFRFFDTDWPHDPAAIALTTVRYGLETGRIVSADIEANAADHDLTVVDSGGDFDLQSVLTHESGHFFGLAHVIDRDATMFAVYSGGGKIDRRVLEPNDRQGICAVYPPGRLDDNSGCSCTVRPPSREPSSVWWLSAAALWLRRRRRARSQPTATPIA